MNKNNLKFQIPTDLQKALSAKPNAKVKWNNLTPIARRDFVSWIESATQPETRKRRIERVSDMLLKGKRRPCCYAIVPMNLYKALSTNSKAKASWKNLTPDERRDFADWIADAKESRMREIRIEKVCRMLVAGKKHL